MRVNARTILVTGGAGFIGSALVRHLLRETPHRVVNVDKLTYAATPESLSQAISHERYAFEHIDIADAAAVRAAFERHRPDSVMHLAAESHVDRSIDGPAPFIVTNLVGTFTLLEAARAHCTSADFRFIHVSTDEVYGSLGATGAFTEDSCYAPASPYAASKAGADHLVRAWGRTYGLPVVVTNSSNNYGPYQFPEKLIPVAIRSALADRAIPVYGDGGNVRDWIHVEDHVRALALIAERGQPGGTYNVGARCERRNIDVVHAVCAVLDELRPRADGRSYAAQIEFVRDRAGHDRRYAVDPTRLERELGWRPLATFERALRDTVEWYVEHADWCERMEARALAQRPASADA